VGGRMKVNERRTVLVVGVDWPLCVPPNRGEIDAHGTEIELPWPWWRKVSAQLGGLTYRICVPSALTFYILMNLTYGGIHTRQNFICRHSCSPMAQLAPPWKLPAVLFATHHLISGINFLTHFVNHVLICWFISSPRSSNLTSVVIITLLDPSPHHSLFPTSKLFLFLKSYTP